MRKMLDEHRVKLLEERTKSDETAMSANAIDEQHELGMLLGELSVDLLE